MSVLVQQCFRAHFAEAGGDDGREKEKEERRQSRQKKQRRQSRQKKERRQSRPEGKERQSPEGKERHWVTGWACWKRMLQRLRQSCQSFAQCS